MLDWIREHIGMVAVVVLVTAPVGCDIYLHAKKY